VIACDRDPGAPGFAFADRRAVVSAEDETTLAQLARAEQVNGVIAPGIDWPVAVAARIAAQLGLQHSLAPETAALAVSKQRQRERLAEAGVPQPRWHVTTQMQDGLPLPAAVKPADRQGQKGLTLVTNTSALAEAVELAVSESRSGIALVEEYVAGPEITVNAFSVTGRFHPLTVTDRLTAEPPAFGVALAHAWPSEAAGPGAVEVARRAAEALGIADGPTYTQIRIGAGGPQVVELAARLGGGHDAELCHAALGVDLNGLALAAALGERVTIPEPIPSGGACVRFLVPPEGQLVRIEGVEQALELQGVLDARVYRAPGYRFGPFRRGADRAGFVLAHGDSRDDALARADRAAERIRFVTADVDAPIEA
jgi:biotin carboxylase